MTGIQPVHAPGRAPGRAKAVCHRCGSVKAGPLVPCKSCGFTPIGQDRAIAWLFSELHLSPDELAEAARRLREGLSPDPSKALRRHARVEMGAQRPSNAARDPLPTGQLILLSVGNMLLTPLIGYAVWFGLREHRPGAARQALRVTVPVTVGMTVVWLGFVLAGVFP